MKRFILLILPLLLFACKDDSTETITTHSDKTFDAFADIEEPQQEKKEKVSPKEEFEQANAPMGFDSIPIERRDSSLILPLENGEHTFTSFDIDYPGGVRFEFHGINQHNDFYIVEGHYWEWYEFYLVNRTSGSIDTIWTDPIFSPNNQLLISKSTDFGLEGHPNGYQIWQLNSKKRWTKIYEIDQQDWIPLDFRWISNDTFVIQKAAIGDYHGHQLAIQPRVEYERVLIREL